MTTQKKTRILILGGGFGGIYAAMHLDHIFGRDPDVEITLVNRDNFFLFTPMLHEVASCDLDVTHIVNPIRKLLRKASCFVGDVEAIDVEAQRVRVSHGSTPHCHDLEYDYLILGLGAVTNFFKIPGVEERALTMKTLGDAIHLRNSIIAQMEEADAECAAGMRDTLLTVVVAGGGFAGVETIASINDFAREALRFYPNLREKSVRMVLVHPGEYLLPELGESLGRYAQRKLTERKVEVLTHTRVASMDAEGVLLTDGQRIPTRMLVWTAGISPNPLLASLPCQTERGRVCVDACLAVPNWPGVWALGDCAHILDPDGKPYPPTAQHAIRQGKILAQNIKADLRGGQKRPFVFSTIGLLASIGRRAGVATIFGRHFSGFLAWFLWRSIYLSKLPTFEKKVRVALDWTLDLLFAKDTVQFLTVRSLGISHPEPGTPENAVAAKVKLPQS